MRIALVIEHYDPPRGGAELSSSQIVDALVERGHDLTVLAGRCPDGFRAPGVTVHRCPGGPPRRGRAIPPFVAWVRGELAKGFDVSFAVVTWLPADVLEPRSGVVAEARARQLARRSPLARLLKRAEYLLSSKQRRMLALERRQLERGPDVPQVVAISRYMKEQLVRHYGLDPGRIPIIENGAEMPKTDPAWRADVRREHGVADDQTAFLFLANDPWRKGVQPLLRAVQQLPKSCVLLVAGRPDAPVERLVERLGVGDRVRLLGQVRQPAPLFAAADVTVLPSYYDPASKVVIESLIMGTPALTTAYNGSRDYVDGGDHPPRGRVVDDPDDVDALARAMKELADPAVQKRCRLASAGLRDELSMRRHAERLEAVLLEVAEKKANP